jgi:hypothetical protein
MLVASAWKMEEMQMEMERTMTAKERVRDA